MRVWTCEIEAVEGVHAVSVPAGAKYAACSFNKNRNTVSIHALLPAETAARDTIRVLIMREDSESHVDTPGDWMFACRWDSPMQSGHAYVEVPRTKKASVRGE